MVLEEPGVSSFEGVSDVYITGTLFFATLTLGLVWRGVVNERREEDTAWVVDQRAS